MDQANRATSRRSDPIIGANLGTVTLRGTSSRGRINPRMVTRVSHKPQSATLYLSQKAFARHKK